MLTTIFLAFARRLLYCYACLLGSIGVVRITQYHRSFILSVAFASQNAEKESEVTKNYINQCTLV